MIQLALIIASILGRRYSGYDWPMAVVTDTATIPAARPSTKRPTTNCQIETLDADTSSVTTERIMPRASGRRAPERSAQCPPSTPPSRLAATKLPATRGNRDTPFRSSAAVGSVGTTASAAKPVRNITVAKVSVAAAYGREKMPGRVPPWGGCRACSAVIGVPSQ